MPKKLGFSWNFLGNFLWCPKKLGIFWDFLGNFRDPKKSGIILGLFWDFTRLLEYSDIFYVSLRRFWILLLRALVTHTYNTYERLFRHCDVYKCFFLLPCDCFGPTCVSPKSSQNHPNFFGMIPNFLGLTPNDPRNFGIFWDLFGRVPKTSQKNWVLWGFFGVTRELLGFSCENPKWPQNHPKNPKRSQFFWGSPKK